MFDAIMQSIVKKKYIYIFKIIKNKKRISEDKNK